ncbi:hypothetical protein [Sporosarcina sp. P33]|uniref:hypothetical protein n=1 Tax=Sporosarcina sp. P33 TaxID=1930764 RepID=UPI0009BF90B6|nr:hypothetical protein [Sporosarcina sp. P33]ARD47600.1 hypothetical protein SporoP33_04670 [Sporosarcina sp. P33]
MFDVTKRPYINGKPEFWITGIKIETNGFKRYKCRYYCECGHKGSHYIPLGIPQIECHECDYHIQVLPAGRVGRDGIPKRDKQGAFYIAHARM